MVEMTVGDAQARLDDVVDTARAQHDPVYLTRRGQRGVRSLPWNSSIVALAVRLGRRILFSAMAATTQQLRGQVPPRLVGDGVGASERLADLALDAGDGQLLLGVTDAARVLPSGKRSRPPRRPPHPASVGRRLLGVEPNRTDSGSEPAP